MPLSALPRVPAYALDREFLLDQANEEVTCIDIAPHAAFCIVACSNGAVLLFDLTNLSNQRNGYLIAQIRPKGMHTSLRLMVKICDDARFCFVGVRKGSSDMVAIDLQNYPVYWDSFPSPTTFSRARKQVLVNVSELFLPHFDIYTHSDPKLRGFGTATTIPIPENSPNFAPGTVRFWLACGMGIKNVHVWQMTLAPVQPSSEPFLNSTGELIPTEIPKRDTWICILDVPTNGSSISHLGFRAASYELLTKCTNMNLRVWDLSQYDIDPSLKPSYEDIFNSTDVKCLLEQSVFCLGGAYEFAVIKAGKAAPKEANRNAFDLPEKVTIANTINSFDDDVTSNLRRRRYAPYPGLRVACD
jgi:hypothetical protein